MALMLMAAADAVAAPGSGIVPLAYGSSQLPTTAMVVAGGLADGRFILYDGNGDIWIESGRGAGNYAKVASGYFGDPGFIAVAPDGHRCLVSSGYTGMLWLFDANAPVNAGSPLVTLSGGYWAAWLDNQKLLIDCATWVGPGQFDYQANVVVLDTTTHHVGTVITGGRTASAALSIGNGFAYVTDGITGATNRFAVADLLNAYATATPINWPASPNFGTFNAGGASAVTNSGALIFQGNSVQYVDANGNVLGTDTPNTAVPYPFYTAAYNPATGNVLVVSTDWTNGWPPIVTGWGSDEPYDNPPVAMPVSGPMGLLLLTAAVAALGLRRGRRCA
jgi:hypothetical protein